MLSIKFGARIAGVQPELLLGIVIFKSVLDKYNVDTIVTEVTGGKHMEGSLHYKGFGADIRSKHIKTATAKYKILEESREALGTEFDVILESEGAINEHFHIEYQPKE